MNALRHRAPLEGLLYVADRLRGRLLYATRPWSGRLAGDREARVAFMGVVTVAAAAAGALSFPLWMLALGPILLGGPHLLADIRYCVVRPGWHRDPATWVAVFAPLGWPWRPPPRSPRTATRPPRR